MRKPQPARRTVTRNRKGVVTVRDTPAHMGEPGDPSDRGRAHRMRENRLALGVTPPPGLEGCPGCGSRGGDLRRAYDPTDTGWAEWCRRCGWRVDSPRTPRTPEGQQREAAERALADALTRQAQRLADLRRG